MPVQIINFPFQGQDDKCLVLSNGQWAATGIGTSWKRLWIGVRNCVEDFGRSLSTDTGYFIGVMSNPEVDSNGKLKNGFLSKTSSHVVGMYHSTSSATRYADTNSERMHYATSARAIKRVGATSVTSTSSINLAIFGSTSFPSKRYGHVVELLKSQVGSVYDLTIQQIYGYSATDPATWPKGEITIEDLINAMQASNLDMARSVLRSKEGMSSYGYTVTSTATISVNESTDGPLNAIHIAWGMYSPRLAISEILYVIKE